MAYIHTVLYCNDYIAIQEIDDTLSWSNFALGMSRKAFKLDLILQNLYSLSLLLHIFVVAELL